MTLYIGVDGGGTKTEVVFLNVDKKEVFSLIGPATNPSTVGLNRAYTVIVELILKGLQELHSSIDGITGLSIGMAGVNRLEQAESIQLELKKHFQKANFEVVNDALPALTAGTGGSSGIVLIAGTGSIAVGEDEAGHTARSGGYGNLIGDEGSGFDVGRMGLMAAIQGFEGRGPKTQIWQSAMEFFKIRHAEELITKVYESSHPVGTIASFAKEVLHLWEKDEEANRIIHQAIQSYAKLIDSVYHKLADFCDHSDAKIKPNVILAGGLFLHNEMLVSQLADLQPTRSFHVLKHKPATGAVLRAMRQTAALEKRALSKTELSIWEEAAASLAI
jgi:N-acetylglucosamine kinase-like BadF-type ATPase